MPEDMKISLSVAPFGSGGDRYSPKYREPHTLETFLEKAATVPGVQGIDIAFPFRILGAPDDVVRVGEMIGDAGLKVANLMVDNYIGPEWQFGAFTACDQKVRAKSIAMHKELMELSEALESSVAGIWLAHDGFDYVMQVDYNRHWDMLVEAFGEVMAHRPNVRAAIEYKLKDPRTFCHIANVGTALMLIEEVGAPNLGVLLDMGHSLIARENPAEAAVLCMRREKLYHLHLNENYRAEDIDLIFGSVHVWESIELLYWLNKMGYEGWFAFDVISSREDPARACNESVAALRQMMDIARRLDAEEVEHIQRKQDAVSALKILRRAAFR